MACSRLLLAALILALPAARAGARPFEADDDDANPSILSVNRTLGLGYLTDRLYYLEPDGAGTTGSDYLDYEKGAQKGARVTGSYMTPGNHWYLQAQWSGSEGRVGYTGHLLASPLTPVTGTSRATTQEAQLKAGKGFELGDHFMLTPYLGGGWRYWVRELGVGTSGDYNESYDLLFGMVGGMLQCSPVDRVVVAAEGGIGRTFHASINVPKFGLDHAPLGSKPVVKAGADLDLRVTAYLHLFASVDYTHFQFGPSPVYGPLGVYEPYSKTTIYDGAAGIRVPLWMGLSDGGGRESRALPY